MDSAKRSTKTVRQRASKANVPTIRSSAHPERDEMDGADAVTSLSVRLPRPMYLALRTIVHEEVKRGQKSSLHSLILEGISKVIAERG